MEDDNILKKFERRAERRADLVVFLTKISDVDLVDHTLEEHLEGYWMSLQKADEEAENFNLEG